MCNANVQCGISDAQWTDKTLGVAGRAEDCMKRDVNVSFGLRPPTPAQGAGAHARSYRSRAAVAATIRPAITNWWVHFQNFPALSANCNFHSKFKHIKQVHVPCGGADHYYRKFGQTARKLIFITIVIDI